MESHSHEQHKTHDHHKHHRPSNSDLLSYGKVIAEAATAGLHHDTDKIDKGKIAGAAADLMGAASYYGKLKEKEVYREGRGVSSSVSFFKSLHQFYQCHSSNPSTNSTHSTTTTTTHSHSTTTTTTHIKMAQEFLKKH